VGATRDSVQVRGRFAARSGIRRTRLNSHNRPGAVNRECRQWVVSCVALQRRTSQQNDGTDAADQLPGCLDFAMAEPTLRGFPAMHSLGRSVLECFGVRNAKLRLLRHEHNTTFRVDSGGQRFVLRINRPGVHDARTIDSEMHWLAALARDTSLGVPVPVAATDGRLVVTVKVPSSDTPRHGVLLRWQPGRFVDENLSPKHLAAVGRLHAGLHRHAAAWERPAGFLRPRVDTLTNAGKVASISPFATAARRPSAADAAQAMAIVEALLGVESLALVRDALSEATDTAAAVEAVEGPSGLIHADLHYENFLFDKGHARAIDFDDCGWGPRLYDLAITLWELQERADYPSLRDALLDAYGRHFAVPVDYEALTAGLIQLRRVQILLWILQSHEHPAFADDWRESAQEQLEAIRRALSVRAAR
jgi:Ser/Thr protein kinase RdoA (MazF antagonist)